MSLLVWSEFMIQKRDREQHEAMAKSRHAPLGRWMRKMESERCQLNSTVLAAQRQVG